MTKGLGDHGGDKGAGGPWGDKGAGGPWRLLNVTCSLFLPPTGHRGREGQVLRSELSPERWH